MTFIRDRNRFLATPWNVFYRPALEPPQDAHPGVVSMTSAQVKIGGKTERLDKQLGKGGDVYALVGRGGQSQDA